MRAQNPSILHSQEEQEYYFKEGCFILELLNSEIDPEVSIARARVEVGGTTRLHRLQGVTERYLVLSGEGRVEVDQIEEQVTAGSVVVIPAGCRQSIHNTGGEELVFLAICSPRFEAACYEDLGP